MQIRNYKFHWSPWLFVLGFILYTSCNAFASEPNYALYKFLSSKNFTSYSSTIQNYSFNKTVINPHHYGFNVINNSNVPFYNNSTPLSNTLDNPIQIITGETHTCAISNAGKLFCWGHNRLGELGDGTTIDKDTPTPVNSNGFLNGKSVISVSTGHNYTCAINSDNKLFCWGYNYYGQLGDGTNGGDAYKRSPTLVNSTGLLGGKTVKSVSARSSHTCAINNEDELFCWGRNDYGQLGDGTNGENADKNIPTPVNTDWLIDGKTVKSVSAGAGHTCAINSNNELFCWGRNDYGQLGDGTNGENADKNTPTPVNTDWLIDGKTVKSVSAGAGHTCAINSNNELYCWGYNEQGQLGNGTSGEDADKNIPTPVNSNGLLGGKTVKNVSAGQSHTCAINSVNQLFCWGRNFKGQLGDGTNGENTNKNTPTLVNPNGLLDGKTVKSVSAGGNHTCAINSVNEFFCWGWNDSGQLGYGTNGEDTDKNTPTLVYSNNLLNDKSHISVSVGYLHTCAINNEGKLFCWGNNSNGQLGDGTTIDKNTPVPVNSNGLLGGKTVKNVSAGQSHTCAINSDNELFCWGWENYGRLGNNSDGSSKITTPTHVYSEGLLNGNTVISVTAGETHTCAINSVNELFCWGFNWYGQLGDGTNGENADKNIPTPVSSGGLINGNTVISVTAGETHTCAINSVNELFCWGFNSNGQLGFEASRFNTPNPVYPNGLINDNSVNSASVRGKHSCAINNEGKLFCWGRNIDYELGDGTENMSTSTPTHVYSNGLINGNTVKSVSAGYKHTCAISNAGKLFCWGLNEYGQLGDGTSGEDADKNTPTPVNTNGLIGGKTVKSVSAGRYHTCAINSVNELFCWGYNRFGQLGDETNEDIIIPTRITVPEAEICGNDKDDDADGYTDEVDDCECLDSENKLNTPCEPSPNSEVCESPGVNICNKINGDIICYSSPRVFGDGWTYILIERCNGIDDDCDGEIDEEFPTLGDECTDGFGVCQTFGSIVCNENTDGVTCSAKADLTKRGTETCANMGTDDDCDGELDNIPNLNTACEVDEAVGVGACANTHGTKVCTEGNLVCQVTAHEPSVEICNGIDDDCNGDVDEGFTTISGVCYADSDIENIDECNPTDIVINNRCYNPEDYNKKKNDLNNKVKPLPPIVTITNEPGKIEILMEKFTIGAKLKKKLRKKALKKFGIKNAKLRVYYTYIITKISNNKSQNINAFANNKGKKVIENTVKTHRVTQNNVANGNQRIEYRIFIGAKKNDRIVPINNIKKSKSVTVKITK